MYADNDIEDASERELLRTPSLKVTMTPEKEPYEDEIDAESPSSPFLHSSFSSSGGIGGSSRMSSHGGRTISLSTSTSPRVTVVQLSDIGPGSWADVSDDELPMAGRSSAASGSLLAHSDLLPARGHSLTLDSLAANADNACASPRDGISQLSARSEPNFSRHALRPCSPMHYDPMSLTDDYEVLTGAHSVMRPGADSGAGDLSGSRRASDTGPVPNIDHWSSIRETRRNTSSTSSLSAHSHGHTPSRSPSASALASSCSSSASFASVHSSATASASSSTSARPAQSRISPFAPTGIVSPPLSSTQLSPNSFQSPFSLSSGSGPATAAASSRISPRNSGASSRILFGTSNPGSTLTQSTPDAFSFYATSPHSSSSSSLGGSHCATTGASPVTSSPSWARQRARARDGSQSSSSSSSSHRQSLNSTSSAPLTRPRPVLHTYSGASAAVTTTADSQFAGVSSSVLSESALSSSDGYASSVATNDSSARSSIDIQFDRDDMMMVDSVSPSPVPAMGSNRMFSASTSSLGSYTLTHAPSSARTLPMFLEYSNDMGAHHEGETSLNLDDADFSLVRTKTGRDYGYGPANSRASTLATPKESGRSRSRTFGSSEKPWGLKSPQSPSASPVPSPSVSRSVNATAIANSASASTLLSQSASNGQLAYPEAPEKSPTRARVGGASAAFAARTQAFVSNPHPSLHARHRRDSSASNSRPRPRPFGLQQSGSDMEIPKSKGSSVQGLIPNIRALNVAPASPSRPQTILPSFKQRNDGTGSIRIHPETLIRVFSGEYQSSVTELHILDCRSEEEFVGGHIKGAVHCPDVSVIIRQFIIDRLQALKAGTAPKLVIIFHCEYSILRGPAAMSTFREADRDLNGLHWPALFYSDVYCLEGGYSRFFREYPEWCDPVGYVPEPHQDRKSEALVRRSHSVSRIALSRSMGTLPSLHASSSSTYSFPVTAGYDASNDRDADNSATRPRSATEARFGFAVPLDDAYEEEEEA